MTQPIYIYDPTLSDIQSRRRGVGRYVQILKDYLADCANFTDKLWSLPKDSILINPFLNLLAPQKINRRFAKKQIGVIHDLIPFKYPAHFPLGFIEKIKIFFRRWTLHSSYDFFVTDSEASRQDIIRLLKIPQAKIKVIYPTFSRLFAPHLVWPPDKNSQQLFHHAQNQSPQPIFTNIEEKIIANQSIRQLTNYVLYVGDATWNKNLVTLAKAIKTANITCVCVGAVFNNPDPTKLIHPWQKELRLFLNEIAGDKRFILLGYVTDTDLIYLYKKARVNILISRDEGFGFSFLEAGIMSTPSVLSDIPVFRELAKKNALFAKTNDVVDIASKLAELYFNPQHREIYSIKAFERAEDFQPSIFRQNWLETIKSL